MTFLGQFKRNYCSVGEGSSGSALVRASGTLPARPAGKIVPIAFAESGAHGRRPRASRSRCPGPGGDGGSPGHFCRRGGGPRASPRTSASAILRVAGAEVRGEASGGGRTGASPFRERPCGALRKASSRVSVARTALLTPSPPSPSRRPLPAPTGWERLPGGRPEAGRAGWPSRSPPATARSAEARAHLRGAVQEGLRRGRATSSAAGEPLIKPPAGRGQGRGYMGAWSGAGLPAVRALGALRVPRLRSGRPGGRSPGSGASARLRGSPVGVRAPFRSSDVSWGGPSLFREAVSVSFPPGKCFPWSRGPRARAAPPRSGTRLRAAPPRTALAPERPAVGAISGDPPTPAPALGWRSLLPWVETLRGHPVPPGAPLVLFGRQVRESRPRPPRGARQAPGARGPAGSMRPSGPAPALRSPLGVSGRTFSSN